MMTSDLDETRNLPIGDHVFMRRGLLSRGAMSDALAIPLAERSLTRSMIQEILSDDIAARLYLVHDYVLVICDVDLTIQGNQNVIPLYRRKNQFLSYEIAGPVGKKVDPESKIHILNHGSITHFTVASGSEVYCADLIDVSRFVRDERTISPVQLHDAHYARGFIAAKDLAGMSDATEQQRSRGTHSPSGTESVWTRLMYHTQVTVAGTVALVLNAIVLGYRPGSNEDEFVPIHRQRERKKRHERADKLENFLRKIMQPVFKGILRSRLTSGYSRFRDHYDKGQFEEAMKYARPLLMTDRPERAVFGFGFLFDNIKTYWPDAPLVRKSSSVWLSPSEFNQFRMMYEAMVTELTHQGKVDKAAYIIADLLDNPDRAVHLLLASELNDLALRLAESRESTLAVKIRACLANGDITRACEWATLGGIQSLDIVISSLTYLKVDTSVIDEFIYAFSAQALARGSIYAAIDALWTRESTRERSLPLLEEVLVGANPSRVIDVCRIVRLLHDVDPVRSESILQHLCTEQPTVLHDLLKVIKPMFVRSMSEMVSRAVRATLPHVEYRPSTWKSLQHHLGFMGLKVLATDLQNVTVPDVGNEIEEVRTFVSFSYEVPYEVGSTTVLDVTPISDNTFLCALGSEGCVIINASGKIIRRLQRPTTHIIRDDQGACDLLVEKNGRTTKIAMYDRVFGRLEEWTTILCDTVPDQWNGSSLLVLDENRIRCLALGGLTVKEITQWYDEDLIPRRLIITSDTYYVVCMSRGNTRKGELWSIQRQQCRLYRRQEFKTVKPFDENISVFRYRMYHLEEGPMVPGAHRTRLHTFCELGGDDTNAVKILADKSKHLHTITEPVLQHSMDHVIVNYSSESRRVLDCVLNVPETVVARVILGPSDLVQATARVVDHFYCIGTRDGRVVIMNLYTGRPICEVVF